MMTRLQKILARAGIASRRGAEELIRTGHVRVNGAIRSELGTRADPASDDIRVDGKRVRLPSESLLLIGHKPAGVVTSMGDPQGRPNIQTIWPKLPRGVFPVGRLDFNSTGLLLLTNDGDLAHRLLHPSHGVVKTYWVKIASAPSERSLQRLREGVRLEDGKTAPARVRLLRTLEKKAWIEISIHEGRSHQVRRMCDAVGILVDKLKRTAFGPLKLAGLPPGGLRPLTAREAGEVRKVLGVAEPSGKA
jgi:pseudouridine synthase